MNYLRKSLFALFISLSTILVSDEFVVGVIKGQLGNQLFQIAATLSVAYDNKAHAVFPHLKTCNKWNIPHNYKHIFSDLDTTLPSTIKLSKYNESKFHYVPIPYKPNVKIEGHFQSEKYFKKYKSMIVYLFQPNLEIRERLQKKHKDLLAHPKTVAVHFRHYFDTRPEYHPTLRNSYYRKCFAKFDKEHLFVIFSNDIKRAKIYFSRFRVKYNILFIENSPHLDDFYLMSLCKHNIIANSSFSWWSAYLNMNPKKRVLTPSNKHWFGPAYKNYNTEDLLPDEWEKVF